MSAVSHTAISCCLLAALGLGACRPSIESQAEPDGAGELEQGPGAEEEVAAQAVGAVAVCSVCHGANGEGNERLGAPRIGGMESWYIARQLRYFKQGIRAGTDDDVHGTQMRAIAYTLTRDEVIDDLAAHYESLTPDAPPETIMEDATRGAELYVVCTACHMEDGAGSRELDTPSIVDQHDWYVVRQIVNYRDGLRGSHPEDEFGAQMAPVVQSLESRQDVLDLVSYINTF